MSKSLRIISAIACSVAILVMSGSHWFALQSWAWMRMAVQFSQTDSLRGALAKTFSGRYPCALCLKVQQGWQQQQQQEKRSPWLRADSLPEMVWTFRFLTAPAPADVPGYQGVFSSQFFYNFSESPPTPPPRA